ncbi:MAG: Gfo/Idh/MocA family oxidoreductase [Pirellulaceae bacterium]|nr:Gfo/Idh/MocA family oxidoreductase [Pirellulaceae bacterium]
MQLRIGIVGLGSHWDKQHKPALRALADRFRVTALCDEVQQRAEQTAREFNAEATSGFRNLIKRTDIDAILMLGSQWFGALPIFTACDYGKAVYSNLFLDLSPDRAQALKSRITDSGISFMSELPRRLAPATLRLQELMATKLGKPQLLFCHQRIPSTKLHSPAHQRLNQKPYWPGVTRSLLEMIDWCCNLVSAKPYSITTMGHSCSNTSRNFFQNGKKNAEASLLKSDNPQERGDPALENPADEKPEREKEKNEPQIPSPTYQVLSLAFEEEMPQDKGERRTPALAQISCGQYIPDAWPEAISFRSPAAIQVRCERGIAFIDLPDRLVWFDSAGQHIESLEQERPVGEQLLMHFYRSTTSLVRRTSDIHDTYRAFEIIAAAEKSLYERRTVFLTDPNDK